MGKFSKKGWIPEYRADIVQTVLSAKLIEL